MKALSFLTIMALVTCAGVSACPKGTVPTPLGCLYIIEDAKPPVSPVGIAVDSLLRLLGM